MLRERVPSSNCSKKEWSIISCCFMFSLTEWDCVDICRWSCDSYGAIRSGKVFRDIELWRKTLSLNIHANMRGEEVLSRWVCLYRIHHTSHMNGRPGINFEALNTSAICNLFWFFALWFVQSFCPVTRMWTNIEVRKFSFLCFYDKFVTKNAFFVRLIAC